MFNTYEIALQVDVSSFSSVSGLYFVVLYGKLAVIVLVLIFIVACVFGN